MRPGANFSRGTVSLVALCFVAVLGIALSSYLAICTRSMTLSNRSFQSGLSQQLAELGLEEGLRAFNKGDWGGWSANPSGITGATTAWTLDSTNKRASRTLTYDSTRLGQSVTATVKIRVDNYDANVLGSTYNSSATYRVNDIVYYSGAANVTGNWYRSVVNGNTNHNPLGLTLGYPDLNYWVPAPIPSMWSSNVTYKQYDLVCYGATASNTGKWWYSNINSNTSTPGVANWTALPVGPILALTAPTSYLNGSFGFRNGSGTWYYCIADNNLTAFPSASWNQVSWSPTYTSFTTPNVSWGYLNTATYSYNDLVFYSGTVGVSGTWYRCTAASSTGNAPTNTSYWENALTGLNTTSSPGALGWSSSSINYNIGDVVCYYTASTYNFYRCIRAHTSSTSLLPTNTTYWAITPLLSQDWQPNHQYSQYDTVRYKGVWYLSLTNTNTAQLPNVASSAYWAAAPQTILPWDSTTYYEVDDLVNNSGTWYRCIAPHKAQTPPNATYWTVLIGSGSSYVWSGATAYTVGSYRSYGGVWYKCLTATTANDGHTPNDSTYWTPTWGQPSNTNIVTGAPIVYAEAIITIAGSPPIRTQLRAPIAPAPLFPNAVGSTSTLAMDSGGTVDSFDGSVRSMNTGGTTSTFTQNDTANSPFSGTNANIGFTASVAATGTTSPSLTVTSTTVKGFLAASPATTTPYAPLASFGSAAILQNSDGTTTAPDAIAIHVDLSRISRSPYVPQFDTQPAGELTTAFSSANFPRGSAIPTAITGDVVLGIPGAISPARYSFDGNLLIGSGGLNTLSIVGPVILYINGDFQITTATANVLSVKTTGSAEIHVAGSLKIDAAGGGIDNSRLSTNPVPDPKKLIIICHTAAASTQYYQDVGAFYGVIYAPYTTNSTGLYLNNASSTPFFGALSAAKVEFQNNATVHYDTSLRYATFGGVDQPYTVTQWRELPAAEQATMP